MLKGVVHDFPETGAFLTCVSYLVAAELKSEFLHFHLPAHLTQIVALICYMHATEEVSYF